MTSWLTVLALILGYAIVFFFIALWETRNLRDAFYEWIQTMSEWRNHAIPGVIFLIILAFIGYVLGESDTHID